MGHTFSINRPYTMATSTYNEISYSKNSVRREYHRWFSPFLQKDMEMLVFGHSGKPVLLFPTRTAKFYDYEDWGVIDAISDKIFRGEVQIFCVDSADRSSLYCKTISPAERIKRHFLYERYILEEVIPFIEHKNNDPFHIIAGCSLGGFHAVNMGLRYPYHFKKVIGLSGRYDLTLKLEYFDDLFDGFSNEDILLNTPVYYVNHIKSPQLIRVLQKLEIILAIGVEDAFLQNNILLSNCLTEKNIHNTLYFWDGEAHKAVNWGQMLQKYL